MGKIEGTVYNQTSGDPLIKAKIEVINQNITVETGVEGEFSISLPPGTYTLRFMKEGFVDQPLENISVAAGETRELSTVLQPVGSGETINVTAGNTNDLVGQLEDRKAAATVSDTISALEISKDTSSNAAGVLQRVPGVSLVDRFVFVRGLGERYSNTSLNDAVLPTTEPDRKVVPMDLIPASLLQNVRILKTFTPDQPGEFSGGLVRLETIDFPKSASLSAKFSLGFNSKTHDRDFFGYPGNGGFSNFFGFGRGRRDLPSGVPENRRVTSRNIIDPTGFTPEELERLGESFTNVFTPRAEDARPEMGWSISGGGSFGRFGLVGALSFKNEPGTQVEDRIYYLVGQGGLPVINADYDYTSSTNVARLGGALNLTYKLTPSDSLFFKNFLTNQATDEARIFEGFYLDRGSNIRNTRLRYIEERIYTTQLSGTHLISALGDTVANWRFTFSRATLDEPDLRESLYEFSPTVGDFIYFPQTQSLFHLFNEMRENVREPAFDLAKYWFFKGTTLNTKLGASYVNRDRVFDSRRFRFLPRPGATIDIDTALAPEQILSRENIRPERGFELREETRQTDHYDALHNVTAGYLMGDWTVKRWRFIGGARVEKSVQRVITFEPFRPELQSAISAELENTDVLPALGIVYSLRNGSMNLRGGLSRTVARPQFRELSPFEFTDVTGGRSVVGNPDLKRTLITNYDVRYEWFFKPGELVAVSFFYKDLADPIEIVIEPTVNLRASFFNAEKARNKGVELELRKNLGDLWGRLDNLAINANYTFVRSRVTISEEDRNQLTTLSRPLVGQAENIVNLSLDYTVPQWRFDARALFNYTGERITEVGAVGLPDVIEHGYPSLDIVFGKEFGGERRWRAEVEIENLLDRQVDFRQGDQLYRRYRTGRSFEFGVSYRIF
jgi:outer membrane receptor protein involved in Fe transport